MVVFLCYFLASGFPNWDWTNLSCGSQLFSTHPVIFSCPQWMPQVRHWTSVYNSELQRLKAWSSPSLPLNINPTEPTTHQNRSKQSINDVPEDIYSLKLADKISWVRSWGVFLFSWRSKQTNLIFESCQFQRFMAGSPFSDGCLEIGENRRPFFHSCFFSAWKPKNSNAAICRKFCLTFGSVLMSMGFGQTSHQHFRDLQMRHRFLPQP